MPFSNVKSVHSGLLKAAGLMLVQTEDMAGGCRADQGAGGGGSRELASL